MHCKLRKLRLSKNIPLGIMAKKLNISTPFYCQIESGRRRLSYEMAVKIAKLFNRKPDSLFYEDYEEKI